MLELIMSVMSRVSWIAGCVLSVSSVAHAGLTADDFPPLNWVEQALPEKLPELTYPAYADELDRAKIEMQTGRYRRALQTLRLARGIVPEERQLMEAEIFCRIGRYDQAAELLQGVAGGRAARWLATALAGLGERIEAERLLEKAVEAAPESGRLRYELARLQESMGQLSKAKGTLAWFTLQRLDEAGDASADELVALAAGLDRRAVIEGLYRDNPSLHQQILATFVRAYDVVDRHDIDSHIHAAEFFLRHNDPRHAREELIAALKRNPNQIQAMRLVGEVALADYDFDGCDEAIVGIRRVNPSHPAATMLQARMLLMQRLPEEAARRLEPILAADPSDAEAMALMVACDALRFDREAMEQRLKQWDRTMPQSSLAAVTAAKFLLAAYQFTDAAQLLERAVERTPHWNVSRNLLALAYMQGVEIEKAKPVLEEARRIDPFNVETTNYLRLLDSLSDYAVARSEHFAVRYHPEADPFLASEVLAYMEEQYPRICEEFGYEPRQRTFIELMPTHEDFSVRTTGKPWLATIGASTGPVITMVAPRSKGKTLGAYDWCDVARHEFVHTVTLGATGQRIPRWMTEGLAVAEESSPLEFEQAMRLAEAVGDGRLFSINRINWAFIRPQRPEDRPLAYSQGYWLCCFIDQAHGRRKLLELMQAYGQGLSTQTAIGKVLGLRVDDFDRRFAQWAGEQVKLLGIDTQSKERVKQLKQQGADLLKANKLKEALPLFEQAYAICRLDPLINQRLAGLYLHGSIGRPEKAVDHLRELDRQQLKDNRYALRLSRLYVQLNRPEEAVTAARRATQIDPYDPLARKAFAEALGHAGQKEQADKQADLARSLSK